MTDGRPRVRLKKDEDRRVRAGHPWVFSNEIDTRSTPITSLEPGSLVEVHDSRDRFLGRGYVNPHSLIAARLLTREPSQDIDEQFLRARLEMARHLRDALFPGEPFYRLVFGESDGLPGLVVDRFDDVLVVQPTTAGMDRLLPALIHLIVDIFAPTGILVRADSPARKYEGLELYSEAVHGVVPSVVPLRENGATFEAPVLEGQKTGWFFDHRVNRARTERFVGGTRVLDVFSYVGAWGVTAAVFGAAEVLCVDSSAAALQGVLRNAELNAVSRRVAVRRGDAFDVLQTLRTARERFDVVILDPPAFVKRKRDLKEGEQAYRRLNRTAMELLDVNGVLITASCSFHLSRDSLLRAVVWGAAQGGREVQVVEEGHQGPDHPLHPAIPETNYLKAFFVRMLS